MRTTEFKQTAKVGVSGSFINQMMSNNTSIPEVGKGATQLHYSDRTCFEVVEVSADKKTARLQYLEAQHDRSLGGGCGHQNWILVPTQHFVTVTWRNGAWKTVGKIIEFTDSFRKEVEEKGYNYIGQYLRQNDPELADKIYNGQVMPHVVIDGITKEKTVYQKINIYFGSKDYYYDWTF